MDFFMLHAFYHIIEIFLITFYPNINEYITKYVFEKIDI